MSEVKKELNYNNNGNVICDRNILLSIVNLATKEISGVASLVNNFKFYVRSLFSSLDFDGVSIKFNKDGSIIIDIYIKIFYGYSINDVAFKVQENVKNAISGMVDISVNDINVHIVGVEFSKEEVLKNSLI